MATINLHEVSKSPAHCVFAFEKKQELLEKLRNVLKTLDVKAYDEAWRPTDEEYSEPLMDQEHPIEDLTDTRSTFTGENCIIDVVFGQKKVFAIFSTTKDLQRTISDAITAFAEMVPPARPKQGVEMHLGTSRVSRVLTRKRNVTPIDHHHPSESFK